VGGGQRHRRVADPLGSSLDCEADVAQVESLAPPATPADSAAHLVTARYCSTGGTAATLARYALDLAAGSAGRLRVVALDPGDSTRVIESNEAAFNGGVAGDYPPVILHASSSRVGVELAVDATGTGLVNAQAIAIAAPDERWRVNLTIVGRSDASLRASAAVAADIPVCVVEAVTQDGASATAPLAANSAYGGDEVLWYPSVMAETLGVSVTPPGAWVSMQPKDFAFIHALSRYHLFYIRRRMIAGTDSTEKNLGHAWSTDLQTWHWSQLPRDTSVLDVRDGTWDDYHVWAPSIVAKDGAFHMFYTGVKLADDGKQHQQIGVATSLDLDNWTRPSQPVLSVVDVPWASKDPPADGQQLRDPFVMPDPERPGAWLMYFVAVDSANAPAMAVGNARSNGDFSDWTPEQHPLRCTDSVATRGAHRAESPHVVPHDGRWWLFFTPGSLHGGGDALPYSPVAFVVTDSLGSPTDTLASRWTSPVDTLYHYNCPHPDPRLQYWHASEHLVVADHEYPAAYDDSLQGIAIGEINWIGARDFVVGSASAANVGVGRSPGGSAGEARLSLAGAMPARAEVALRVELPGRARVRLGVYDVAGRLVRTVVDDELPAGATTIRWDARGAGGERVGSGLYFVRLTHPRGARVAKAVLLR
jgi:beta-fructofuranosidase